MKIKISLFALVLLFAPTFAFAADVHKSGTLSSNETWSPSSGVYVITDNFTVPTGVTLTIDPGTIVKIMPSGSWSQVLFTVSGTLSAVGTPSQNITFTSYKDDIGGDTNGDPATPAPGDWAAIVITSTGTANFSYSKISYAGRGFSYSPYYADVYNDGGNLSLTNSIISSSENSGIVQSGGVLSVVSTTFQGNAVGINAFGSSTVSLIDNTFTNNTKAGTFAFQDGLRLSTSGNTASGTGGMNGFGVSGVISVSQAWNADTIPYVITDNFTIPQGVTLTLNPGTIVKIMPSGPWSQILFTVSGTLSAIGAPSQNITFTSYKDNIGGDTNGDSSATSPNAGDWAAIAVTPTGTANFSYSKISYAGQWFNYGPYVADVYNDGGNLSLTNSIISSSASSGVIHAGGTLSVASTTFQGNMVGINAFGSGTVSITDSTFTNNAKAGTFSFQNGLRLSTNGNIASGTGMNGFGASGMISTSQTWNADGIPYVVTDNFTIPTDVTLTLDPGTIVKIMPSGPWSQILFTIQGTLSAVGTPSQNITFTSYKDDIGNDTNGNGTATTPSPGDWSALAITSTGTANFSYSKISYAGQWFNYGPYVADIYNDGGNLSLTHSTISSSASSGIIHAGGTTNISQSSIHDNVGYGVNNVTTVVLNAKNNYWGSLNGPTHASNPLGTGDRVSDYVDFTPPLMFDPTGSCSVTCYSNVMFLPGNMGSNLYDDAGKQIWLSDGDETADYLKMNSFGLSTNNLSTKGAIEEGGLAQGTVNIYKSFIAEMREWETVYGITATTTPYDWRLDYDTVVSNGRKLSNGNISYLVPPAEGQDPYIIATLKKLASTSKTGKVTIIAHSQGGLITKALTAKLGNTEASKYIDKIIFVATPQLGTPQAFAQIMNGVDAGIFATLSPEKSRQLSQNMQSAYNLLPSGKYFTYVDKPVAILSTTTPASWQTEYGNAIHWDQGMYDFMSDSANVRTKPTYADLANPEIASVTMLSRAKTVHNEMDNWIPPEGVSFTTVAGWGNETLAWLEYYGKKDCTFVGFNDITKKVTVVCTDSPHVTMTPKKVIDGDGTVVEPSAHYANGQASTRYWVDLDKYNPWYVPKPLRTGHKDIFEVPELRTLLTNILTNGTTSFPDKYISTVAPAYHGETLRLHFILHSPLALSFADTEGKITGLSSDGTVRYDIPGVEYERYGETQWLSVPKEIAGTIKMHGIANGSFDLQIEEVNGNDTVSKTSFETIPSGISTVVTMNILPTQSATASSILSVDFDGNGSEDMALIAEENSVVSFDQTPPEAKISVDSTTKDLKIEGVDENPTTVTKNGNNYVVTDSFGNATTLFFQKTYSGKNLTYAKLTAIQYGNNPKISVPSSSFLYIWLLNNLVSQTIVVNDIYVIEAVYAKAKNQTTVYLKKKGAQIQKQVFSDLRVVKLVMNKGVVGYEI